MSSSHSDFEAVRKPNPLCRGMGDTGWNCLWLVGKGEGKKEKSAQVTENEDHPPHFSWMEYTPGFFIFLLQLLNC